MDYIHTEAHQMAYDLSVYLHKKVREMPHYEKFTLQKDIRECIDGNNVVFLNSGILKNQLCCMVICDSCRSIAAFVIFLVHVSEKILTP